MITEYKINPMKMIKTLELSSGLDFVELKYYSLLIIVCHILEHNTMKQDTMFNDYAQLKGDILEFD